MQANHLVTSGDAPPGDRPGAVVGEGPRAVRGKPTGTPLVGR